MTTPPEQNNQTFDAFLEISDFLKWAQDRVGPLAFVGLAISALLWLDFLRFYGIPVSFLSGTTLAALPALFAAVTFVAIIFLIGIVTPGIILSTPLTPRGISLASYYFPGQMRVAGEASSVDPEVVLPSAKHGFRITWLLTINLVGTLWIGWVALSFLHINWLAYLSPLVVILSIVLAAWLLRKSFQQVCGKWITWNSCSVLAGSMLSQNLLALFALIVVGQSFVESTWMSFVISFMFYVIALNAMAIFQLIAATRIVRGVYPDVLKHAALVALAVLFLIAAIEPIGATLASYPMKETAPNGKSCIVISLLPEQANQHIISPSLRSQKDPSLSVKLPFVTHVEDRYYVRTDLYKGSVYAVPVSMTSQFDDCPIGNGEADSGSTAGAVRQETDKQKSTNGASAAPGKALRGV